METTISSQPSIRSGVEEVRNRRLFPNLSFNMKGALQWHRRLLASSDRHAQLMLSQGLDRWRDEGRISAETAAAEKAYLATGEVRNAMGHFGAHLVISTF